MPVHGLYSAEWFPVLVLQDAGEAHPDDLFEVPDGLVERYRAALAEWEAVQESLWAVEGARRAPRA